MASADKTSPKKPKLVRDSFTIPKNEFAAIEAMKTRAIALGTSVKKSELLRAGLMTLQALNDANFKAALAAVPTLKTGRPQAEEVEAEAAKPVKADVASAKAAPVKASAKAPVKAPIKAPAKAAAPAKSETVSSAPQAKPVRSRRAAAATKAA
jgi:hypothetical protein